MTMISKNLVGILFGGAAAQVLASAAWKGHLNAVYGLTDAGTGYRVFKPGNTFNSLAQLVPDGFYILDVRTPGFELPGAVLTGADAAGPALAISELASGTDEQGHFYVRCRLTSNQPGDATGSVLLTMPDPANAPGCKASVWATGVALGQLVDLPLLPLLDTPEGVNQDDVLELFAVAPSGATAYEQFEFGNNGPESLAVAVAA